MGPAEALDLGREAIFTLLKMAAPIMIIALIVGLSVALFQALTQIQEMTLTFVPKIIAIFVSLLVLLPFLMTTLFGFTEQIYQRIGQPF
jgi:flagellar biosynthesis protein FliQ